VLGLRAGSHCKVDEPFFRQGIWGQTPQKVILSKVDTKLRISIEIREDYETAGLFQPGDGFGRDTLSVHKSSGERSKYSVFRQSFH
jgi:hypothetical protein